MARARTPPHQVTLVLMTAVSTVSLTLFLPSLGAIGTEFGVEYATVSVAVGGYLATTAILQLILGPISDQVGRRPVLLGCLLAFVAASLGCALATNIWVFLACRMGQGVIIAGYVLSLAIVRDTTPERQTAGRIGDISAAMALGPMLGPILGGALDAAFGWRANFAFFAVAGLILFAICWRDLGETRRHLSSKPGGRTERLRDLIGVPLFWAYAACGAFSTGAFYIFLAGAPLVAQIVFGMGAAQSGLFIGSITFGFLLGSFGAGRMASRIGPMALMLVGRIMACSGLAVGMGLVGLGWLSPWVFFGSTFFVGLGNGLTVPGSYAAALSVRPALAGSAAGMVGALIVAFGAVATTLTGLVVPEDHAALWVLGLMLCASLASLLAVLAARVLMIGPPGAR